MKLFGYRITEGISRLAFKAIIGQLILYLILFFSFDNRTFFIPIILFWFYLFWLLEDWRQAAWLTLVAIFPFGWGLRNWQVEVPLSFNFLSLGREAPFFHFALSAKFLISVFLSLTLIFRHQRISFRRQDFFLFLFLLLALISFAFSFNQSLGMINYFNILQGVIFYFLARYFLINKKNLSLTIYILLILIIFEGFLALSQLLLGHPLGRIIEESLLTSPYGLTATESVFRFRASGTFTDPNTMAVFWLMVIPLILSQIIYKYPLIRNKLILSIALTISFLGLISTFSRGAFLVFLLITLAFALFLVKKRIFSWGYKFLFITMIVVFLLFSPILIQRVLSLQYSLWGRYSSGTARIELIQESWEMIKQNPLLGVGPGNFQTVMVANNYTGVASHFLYPVHNLYLLLTSELGLPALSFFMIFLILILKRSLISEIKNKELQGVLWGCLGGVIAYLVAVLIYTGMGINLEFFFLFLGILASL